MVGGGQAVRHPADTRVTFKLGLRATISAAASWNTRAIQIVGPVSRICARAGSPPTRRAECSKFD